MQNMTMVDLKAPYLIFLGDVADQTYAKTGLGIIQWRRELVAGQLCLGNDKLNLGVPEMTVQQAAEAGAKSLVIGVAPPGGVMGESWIAVLEQAAAAGLDIVSGLHIHLDQLPTLVAAAKQSGARLIDVRKPAPNLPVGNGIKRSGRRALMVGTDCAVGKKYTALALTKSLQDHNIKATFRATGQTGIMIAGTGIPIDAVVSDFVSGAAEVLSPANDPDHWDVIEGQGSLFNPSFAGVSLGLLHGSQPDAIVLCHDPSRTSIITAPQNAVPSISECIELNLRCGQLTNPDIICAGISINTSGLPEDQRRSYLASVAEQTGLPCVDSVVDGCGAIAELIKSRF